MFAFFMSWTMLQDIKRSCVLLKNHHDFRQGHRTTIKNQSMPLCLIGHLLQRHCAMLLGIPRGYVENDCVGLLNQLMNPLNTFVRFGKQASFDMRRRFVSA